MSDLPMAPTEITPDFELTLVDVLEWTTCTEYLTPTGFALDFGIPPQDVPELIKTNDVIRFAYYHILAATEKLTLMSVAGKNAMINKVETLLEMTNTDFGTGLYGEDVPLFKKAT